MTCDYQPAADLFYMKLVPVLSLHSEIDRLFSSSMLIFWMQYLQAKNCRYLIVLTY